MKLIQPISIILTLSLLVALVSGCGESKKTEQEEAAQQSYSGPITGVAVASDGEEIFYRSLGEGDTALIFLHGWCIDGSYFEHQLDHFKDRYRVVALDLPGHGNSGVGRSEYLPPVYGQDVVEVINAASSIKKVILLAHSMSETVAAEAALQLGDKCIGIIGIDTYYHPADEMAEESVDEVLAGFEQDFEGTLNEMFGEMHFHPEEHTDHKASVLADIADNNQDVCVQIMEDYYAYYLSGAFKTTLSQLKVPIHALVANDPNAQAWAQAYDSYTHSQLEKTGHYPMVTDPEHLNASIEVAIASLN